VAEGTLGVRVVSDPAALKALADPLRLRILEVLSTHPDQLFTVKELAAELGQPVTKLYHHMKLLAASELVRDAETRVVSGIVEHRYGCAQRTIKLDEGMFGAPGFRDASAASAASIVEQARDGLARYLSRSDADFERVSLGRALPRLTADEAVEVREALERVIDEIEARRHAADGPGIARYAVTFLMHPLPDEHSS
jgi:DNA-binding transcriptional ArsR family regulator